MRRRDVQVPFRLSRREAAELHERVRSSGLTREAYLRRLIQGAVPRDAPPPDYFAMMNELHRVGDMLSRISSNVRSWNAADAERYNEAVRLYEQTVRLITEAVILPRPQE